MLFENLKIRDVNLKNRVVVSPMCQYSAKDGYIQTHHKTHYGQLAMGGAGLIFEALKGQESNHHGGYGGGGARL